VSGDQRSHEALEELIVADVLDGLTEPEQSRLWAELRRHGPECPECRRLLEQYGEVAGALALAVPPVPLSDGAEERLLDRAGRRRGRLRPGRRQAAMIAVAAAIALIAGSLGYALAPRGPAVPASFLAFVAQPGTRVISFSATGQQHLAVAVRSGQQRAWVVGSGLPTPSGNHVYELWFQPRPSANMQPAGTFLPKDGQILAPVTVGASFVALAVSIEPAGGSRRPTTQPIFLTKT
jgi:hypothetical protein